MKSSFFKKTSGVSGEGINNSKLTHKLLNTLIFAVMGPFAVATLESDSSLFQALRHSLCILRHSVSCQEGMVVGLFGCAPTRIIEAMQFHYLWKASRNGGRNSQQCCATTHSFLPVMLMGQKAVVHHFASKINCCLLERKLQ